MNADEVRSALVAMRARDLPTHGGRTLAYVFDSGVAEADALAREALAAYGATNGLDPTAFPSLLAMESELVAFALERLHAPAGAVGTVTSGGTESVLLAVQAARDARPDVMRPALVVPATIHAAFHKAAHYFGLELVAVDVDPVTRRADPDAMTAAMDAHAGRVVLVAVSAPSYAHGVVDPVVPIAAAAAARGIRCHVDACIGGWVLPWLERAGRAQGGWDFAADGVTSLSADLHKYAYAPKGASLLLHRSPAVRRPQLFACADWPGYTMLNSTFQSTRSGGPLAAAWAVVSYLGDEGYARLALAARDATVAIADGVASIDHLDVVVAPDTTLLAVTADEACDVFTIADEMRALGWFVQPQLSFRGGAPSLHLTVSAATAPLVGELVDALRGAVARAVAAGPVAVDPALLDTVRGVDAGALDDATFDALLAAAGLAGPGGRLALPTAMAGVNALLDAAPPALREALLTGVLDRMTR